MIPVLETERLRLRAFTAMDLDAYADLVGDTEVMRYIGEGKPLNRTDAWRNMATALGHWHLRGYGLWAVEEKQNGIMVGRIGLINPEGWPGIEAGWMLRRAFWGKGYATEGARAAINYAFVALHLPRVISLIYPNNIGSIRVAERLGERFDCSTTVFEREAHLYAVARTNWRFDL